VRDVKGLNGEGFPPPVLFIGRWLNGKHIVRDVFFDSILEALNVDIFASAVAALGNVKVFGIHKAIVGAAHVPSVDFVGDFVGFHCVCVLKLLSLFVVANIQSFFVFCKHFPIIVQIKFFNYEKRTAPVLERSRKGGQYLSGIRPVRRR